LFLNSLCNSIRSWLYYFLHPIRVRTCVAGVRASSVQLQQYCNEQNVLTSSGGLDLEALRSQPGLSSFTSQKGGCSHMQTNGSLTWRLPPLLVTWISLCYRIWWSSICICVHTLAWIVGSYLRTYVHCLPKRPFSSFKYGVNTVFVQSSIYRV